MASPEGNRVRAKFGMEPEPPKIIDPIHDDPQTPSEFVANAAAVISNRAELGEITEEQACLALQELEDMRAQWGDGWQDRYGPSPEY